jgi:mannose-1-phosphate guanylyltransferase
MKNEKLFGLIMAGGIGSRFWPLSTPEMPKQFLDILGIGKSLFQLTFERLEKTIPPHQIYILTNSKYASIVAEQLPMLNEAQIICEPERKNTAPCILYAALKIKKINPNSTLIVAPSDHLILNESLFNDQLEIAISEAQNNHLVTLGVKPTRPDIGYGYIEFESNSTTIAGQVFAVKQFREKPDLETASEFLSSGNFYWNAGIFIWKIDAILHAFQKYQPGLLELFSHISIDSSAEEDDLALAFKTCIDISIDFAILEHADNVSVVLTSFDWSDLGTWGSLIEKITPDENKNAVIHGEAHFFDAQGNLVYFPTNKKVIIDGLRDFIVIDSPEKLLIIPKTNEGKLKSYLKSMGENV